MALDLEEQEQLDEIKSWWKKNGKIVTSTIIGLLVIYSAFQAWQFYQHKQAVEASTLYQSLLISDAKDLKSIQAKSAKIMDDYGSTPYAGRAALFAAKANYAGKELKSAKAQLEWAISQSKESSMSAMASLQLANILTEEKDYAGALKILDAKHDTGFDGLYWDLKGDILALQGKTNEAKLSYERALTKLEPMGKYRIITQQKLDALG
jgi:predicted negative regulator of RcsB-dependent stress response